MVFVRLAQVIMVSERIQLQYYFLPATVVCRTNLPTEKPASSPPTSVALRNTSAAPPRRRSTGNPAQVWQCALCDLADL